MSEKLKPRKMRSATTVMVSCIPMNRFATVDEIIEAVNKHGMHNTRAGFLTSLARIRRGAFGDIVETRPGKQGASEYKRIVTLESIGIPKPTRGPATPPADPEPAPVTHTCDQTLDDLVLAIHTRFEEVVAENKALKMELARLQTLRDALTAFKDTGPDGPTN